MIRGQSTTVKLARQLRAEMTPPEVALWQALRQRPGGYKFRRQHPAGLYVLDFFCTKARLAIEVDRTAHDSARDAARSRFLREQGIATTRIPAKLVLEDIEAVVRRLVQICDERLEGMNRSPLHHPAAKALDGPPPLAGEDQT